MKKKGIFIAATGQNVGKTTLCLGIFSGLKKRFSSVGFIKPVGQQHVSINNEETVDKDAVLFKEHFHLNSAWSDISPIIFPTGFTRDYLDGIIIEEAMHKKIDAAFHKIYSSHDYTIVEGTGHVGVGSIVNLNNAQIASQLGLDMVIIASGGLGSAHDELALNMMLCKEYEVKVRGVILNKVRDDKREMILNYFPKTLRQWNIPLLGCVPYNDFLSNPTIKDFEYLFDSTLLSGEQHRYRHFTQIRLVAGSLKAYLDDLIPNSLIITPASREDIISATLHIHRKSRGQNGIDFGGGMILTSRHPPEQSILNLIKNVDIPILYVPLCSYDAMKLITSYNAKIRWEDIPKVKQAIDLVEQHIDFNQLTDSQISTHEMYTELSIS